jgi:hypothetical protein
MVLKGTSGLEVPFRTTYSPESIDHCYRDAYSVKVPFQDSLEN